MLFPGCKFCCATGYPAGAYLDLLQRTAHPPRDYHQRLHAAGTTDPRTWQNSWSVLTKLALSMAGNRCAMYGHLEI